ncbi:hypothetical protein [Candidatus Leptofilum sp.]|uniref:hypothetical protein n=1 Tax=Candidatus Leptofilum sp. TaxID=3241576 RepID=UPI003B5CD8D3
MPLIQLEFLTDDDEIINICKDYWEMDENLKFKQSVASIAKTFGLKSNQTSKFVAQHCNAKSAKIVCANCNEPHIFSNRSEFQYQQRYSNSATWICSNCERAERQRKIEDQKALEEQKRFLIREKFSIEKQNRTLDIHSMSLENAVYLLSLVRLGASEDLDSVRPFSSISQQLSPTQEYNNEIIKQLFRENLIFVHPHSHPDAFIFDGISIPQFYIGHVMWALPTDPTSESPKELIINLESIFSTMDWPEHWHEEWNPLWKKIALEECLEYLNVCLDDHGFSFSPGEKTILVFKNVLVNFSVSQTYSMIWRAAKDAAAFYVRKNVTKNHAANTVVGSIQRYSERAKAEGWEVTKYGRDRRCPQSLISQVFFNTVLQIGDSGFNEPPASQN